MGRVREALFSMLAPELAGARLLDLYAGCGLLGLEALSRGAELAIFVDAHAKSVRLIRENLQVCRLAAKGEVVQGSLPSGSVFQAVKGSRLFREAGFQPFDLVLLDPPYRQGLVIPTLEALIEAGMVRPGGVVVAEHEAEWSVETVLVLGETWMPLQNRRYGDTRITLLRYNG